MRQVNLPRSNQHTIIVILRTTISPLFLHSVLLSVIVVFLLMSPVEDLVQFLVVLLVRLLIDFMMLLGICAADGFPLSDHFRLLGLDGQGWLGSTG